MLLQAIDSCWTPLSHSSSPSRATQDEVSEIQRPHRQQTCRFTHRRGDVRPTWRVKWGTKTWTKEREREREREDPQPPAIMAGGILWQSRHQGPSRKSHNSQQGPNVNTNTRGNEVKPPPSCDPLVVLANSPPPDAVHPKSAHRFSTEYRVEHHLNEGIHAKVTSSLGTTASVPMHSSTPDADSKPVSFTGLCLVARMEARVSRVASMMYLRWTRSNCSATSGDTEYHVGKQNVSAQLDDHVDVHSSPF